MSKRNGIELIIYICMAMTLLVGCDYNRDEEKVKKEVGIETEVTNETESIKENDIIIETETMNRQETESMTDNEFSNIPDGGGAEGLLKEYIHSPKISGEECVLTEDIIKMILDDNKVEIMSYIEQVAKERNIPFKKNDVKVYLKGIADVHIDKNVWLAVSSKDIPIILGDKVIGIISIDNTDNRLSWGFVKLSENNMYERAIDDGKKNAILISYNGVRNRMIINELNQIYSDVNISDIKVDESIALYDELYSEYAAIPSDMYDVSIAYMEMFEESDD